MSRSAHKILNIGRQPSMVVGQDLILRRPPDAAAEPLSGWSALAMADIFSWSKRPDSAI